jgi:hypothetical protein
VQTDELPTNTEDAMTTLPDETLPPSPQPMLRIDEGHLEEMVRSTGEQTLNDLAGR